MSYTVKNRISDLKQEIQKFQTSNPFANYNFLNALEKTDCLNESSGWKAQYLLGKNESFIPFYEKNNSQGEFVFDYAWANAYYRYGIPYYPKIVMSVPFTPVEGKRIFSQNKKDAIDSLKSLTEHARKKDFSSIHALYVEEDEKNVYEEMNFIKRIDCNYRWTNKGYEDFEDFLSKFVSRKRKNIKKERDLIKRMNIKFKKVSNISDTVWDEFYLFYALTYARRGQRPYLTLEFFKELKNLDPIIIFAHKEDYNIAAALFFKSSDTLYGRYWGAKEDINFLHFETCYYQGIELAIEQKFKYFDPGIQGQHKLKRGFEPIINSSYHWIKNSEFRTAIKNFCIEESQHIELYFKQALKSLPFTNV